MTGRLGLRGNLRLCLDAGDDHSYASGQPWLDTSGNGYDFNRGSGGGSDAADPTFNGTVGRRSSGEYWSFDGGDYFTYDTTNETWMQNLHKDNAAYSVAAWCYATASMTSLFGTNGGTATTGTGAHVGFGSQLFNVRAVNSGSAALNFVSAMAHPLNTWMMLGVSLNEAAGTGFVFCNGASESFTSTYSSPATGNASQTLQLMARGNAANIAPSGSRLATFAMWEGRALSAGEMQVLFQKMRIRFGV